MDRVSADFVEGWAQNIHHPEAPVCLDIYASGRLIGQVLANRYREDLRLAGIGSGHHGFKFSALISSPSFKLEAVEVCCSLDGCALAPSGLALSIRSSRMYK